MTALDDLRTQARMKLALQIPQVLLYLSYYDGEPAILALLDTEERQVFRRFLDESQANWCSLVANAVAERLQVVGFQWGGSTDRAWTIWQTNSMDADAELVQSDALVTGRGFVYVQPDDSNPAGVSITAESPLEATVLYEPGNRRKAIAGFKSFTSGLDGKTTDILITPDVIATWLPDTDAPATVPNTAGIVGMVEMQPQPRTSGSPRSELDPAIPIQDRIHTTIFNRLVASDFGAFRQIWATGVKLARQLITVTAADGMTQTQEVVVKPFDIGANRLLTNENPDGRFGAFPGDPLAGYLSAVEADISAMAAITQTPPYYLQGHMVNLSADAIKAAEAGLVAKVHRRMLHIGESWEAVIRLALTIVGDAGATNMEGEVLWADPETRSLAQLSDALVKMASIGVPEEVLWQRWGATPAEIEAWKKMKADALAAMPAPAAAPPGMPFGPGGVQQPDGTPAPGQEPASGTATPTGGPVQVIAHTRGRPG
jgi:hypothetical protein